MGQDDLFTESSYFILMCVLGSLGCV